MRKFDPTLYFITDSTGYSEEEFLYRVEEALKGGATLLQLREKDKTTREYITCAQKVHELTRKYRVPLIIDDRIDVALAMGAEGVHLGQSDMPVSTARKILGEDYIIGATTKTVPQALEACEQSADYLGVGAIYPTTTKVKTVLTPAETLDAICKAVPIPVNAIGGLNKNNLQILEGIGIAGLCVVSAIMKADDPKRETAILLDSAKRLRRAKMKAALSIAGSDSSGGAGIQADIKTMTMNGVYAMSVITAVTAQNTTGVRAVRELPPAFLRQQIDAVFEDIFPDAVKIGMVSSSELIREIAGRLKYYKAKNVVIDPVMVSTSGFSLMKNNAVQTLINELLPAADLVTPNIPEAQLLSGLMIENKESMITAAKRIGDVCGCAVLLKGGHRVNDANDLLYADGDYHWFEGRRIDNPNTHGTGCTLSSAIASNLAKGFELTESVKRAKEYISGALSAMLDLGQGAGPMNHAFDLTSHFAEEKL